MYVRQLVGRQAGMIVEMPFEVGKGAIDNGTAEPVTDSEIHAEGLQAANAAVEVPPDRLLVGYRIEPNHDRGGFDLFDPGGVLLNKEEPHHNHAVARDAALKYARKTRGMPEPFDGTMDPGDGEGFAKLTVPQLRVEMDKRGIAYAPGAKKAELVAALERDDEIGKLVASGDLEVLTEEELRAFAAQHKIDLTDKTTKEDVIEAIKAGYKPAELVAA